MNRFLKKPAFGSEGLKRGCCGANLMVDAYKRKYGKAKDAQYS